MAHWFTERPVGRLLPGDHAWFSYSGPEEREHVLGTFLRDGLSASDKVAYITDADPRDLPGLRTRHDIDACLRTGQLTVHPLSETCLTDGTFDPDRMIAWLRAALERAERERFRGFRVTADLTWAIRQRNGRERMLHCEAGMDAVIAPSTTAMAICQVDRRCCTADELTVLKETHEVLAVADPDFDDGILTITRTFRPHGLRLRGELDGARRAVFAEALHALTEHGGDVHLDLSELRLVDLGALDLMAGLAPRLTPGRLVLDNLSPELAKAVDSLSGRPGVWRTDRDGGVDTARIPHRPRRHWHSGIRAVLLPPA